jgi:hypothetical protein
VAVAAAAVAAAVEAPRTAVARQTALLLRSVVEIVVASSVVEIACRAADPSVACLVANPSVACQAGRAVAFPLACRAAFPSAAGPYCLDSRLATESHHPAVHQTASEARLFCDTGIQNENDRNGKKHNHKSSYKQTTQTYVSNILCVRLRSSVQRQFRNNSSLSQRQGGYTKDFRTQQPIHIRRTSTFMFPSTVMCFSHIRRVVCQIYEREQRQKTHNHNIFVTRCNDY